MSNATDTDLNPHHQLGVLRRARGLTLEQMGERCDIAKPQVSRLCSGARDAQLSSMVKAAAAVEGTWLLIPDELLGEVQQLLERHTLLTNKS